MMDCSSSSNCYEGIVFICHLCNDAFSNHQELINHHSHCKHEVKSVKVEGDNLNYCGDKKESYSPLLVNNGHSDYVDSSSSREVIYIKTEITTNDILNHQSYPSNFEKPVVYECENCDMTFANTEYLSRHLVRCKNRKSLHFECNICNRGFTTKGSLDLHVNTLHLKKKNFSCTLCGKSFSQKHILKIHMDTHYNKRNFKCRWCQKTFVQKSNLTRHERIHEEKNYGYICKHCGRMYSQNKYLQTHLQSYHTGEINK